MLSSNNLDIDYYREIGAFDEEIKPLLIEIKSSLLQR
jgi:hypothetical protein